MSRSTMRLALLSAITWLAAGGAGLAQKAPGPVRISVQPNVQISRDRPNIDQGEPVICASLTDPNRLIAAATGQGETVRGEYVYTSEDGGRSWRFVFDTFSKGETTADPACAADSTGALHFTTMHIGSSSGLHTDRSTHLLDARSPDGGKTWEPLKPIEGSNGVVRQFTVFDNTDGPRRGRYYAFYNMGFEQRTTQGQRWTGSLAISRSLDKGKSWQPPALRAKNILTRAVQSEDYEGGNAVVTPTGAVLAAYVEQFGPKKADAGVYVAGSTNGGDTIGAPVLVSKIRRTETTSRPTHPIMAVDLTGTYRGRLYVTWCDVSSGRMETVLSYSDDDGATWTQPLQITRPTGPAPSVDVAELGPVHPWVSVNKDGVVGVMWLDPTGLPGLAGFNVMFAASGDGGETWTAPAKVSDKPSVPILRASTGATAFNPNQAATLNLNVGWAEWDFINGDLAWMDTDLAGRFWPVWADTRTGVRQIWTSAIKVDGAVKARSPLDALRLQPAAGQFALVYGKPVSAGDRVELDVQLKNIGTATVAGRLMIKAADIATGMGQDIRAANSDNHLSSRGAIWDFTANAPAEGLGPGALTSPKRLAFRILSPKALISPAMEEEKLVSLRVNVVTPANQKSGEAVNAGTTK